ncbi:MAG: hypothetical protein PHQ52_07385, partial [Candidatus Omnitrophica bacterium]|nr:hypothetical protein [Candidatus Omnitrophota bacterium]
MLYLHIMIISIPRKNRYKPIKKIFTIFFIGLFLFNATIAHPLAPPLKLAGKSGMKELQEALSLAHAKTIETYIVERTKGFNAQESNEDPFRWDLIGEGSQKRVGVLIVKVQGLLERFGIYTYVLQKDRKPIIYVDADHFYDEKKLKQAKDHAAKLLKKENAHQTIREFSKNFEFVAEISDDVTGTMDVTKWRYKGKTLRLPNGAKLVHGKMYILKTSYHDDDLFDVFIEPQERLLRELNPENKNPYLPSFLGFVDTPSRLGSFMDKQSILFEFIDGKNLYEYVERELFRKTKKDREDVLEKIIMEILKGYKKTFHDKGYVFGDINSGCVVISEHDNNVQRITFVDLDTPTKLDGEGYDDLINRQRKERRKVSLTSKDGTNRRGSGVATRDLCLPRDDVFALTTSFLQVIEVFDEFEKKQSSTGVSSEYIKKLRKVLKKYRTLASRHELKDGENLIRRLIIELRKSFRTQNAKQKPAKQTRTPLTLEEFNKDFKMERIISEDGFLAVIKYKYIGKTRDLPNGAKLRKGNYYILKAAKKGELSRFEIMFNSLPDVYSRINPWNSNYGLPEFITSINLDGTFEKFGGQGLLFEFVKGYSLGSYENLEWLDTVDKEKTVLDIAKEVLSLYQEIFIDRGFVHGDLDPSGIFIEGDNIGLKQVRFIDLDTPSPIDLDGQNLQVIRLQRTFYKDEFAPRDRPLRTIYPEDTAEMCLPRDDAFALAKSLWGFISVAYYQEQEPVFIQTLKQKLLFCMKESSEDETADDIYLVTRLIKDIEKLTEGFSEKKNNSQKTGSPASFLVALRDNDYLLIQASTDGISVKDMMRFREPYVQRTIQKEFEILKSLGILTAVKNKPGVYVLSVMMKKTDHNGQSDLNGTKTLINAINDIKYQAGIKGEEKPLHRYDIPKDKREVVRELVKMTVLHYTENNKQGVTRNSDKVMWHIVEEALIPLAQRTSLVTQLNKFFRENDVNEKMYIL